MGRAGEFTLSGGQRRPRGIGRHEGEAAVNARARQIARQQHNHHPRSNHGDEQVQHGRHQHSAGGKKILAGVAINHGPEDRSEHEKNSRYTHDNGRVGEEQDLEQDQDDPEDEQGHDFPARQSRQVMAEKEQGEANGRQDSRQAGSRNFEFKIGANDATQEEKRGQGGNPQGQALKTGGSESHEVSL